MGITKEQLRKQVHEGLSNKMCGTARMWHGYNGLHVRQRDKGETKQARATSEGLSFKIHTQDVIFQDPDFILWAGKFSHNKETSVDNWEQWRAHPERRDTVHVETNEAVNVVSRTPLTSKIISRRSFQTVGLIIKQVHLGSFCCPVLPITPAKWSC